MRKYDWRNNKCLRNAKFDPCCIIKDIDSAIAAIRGEGCAK